MERLSGSRPCALGEIVASGLVIGDVMAQRARASRRERPSESFANFRHDLRLDRRQHEIRAGNGLGVVGKRAGAEFLVGNSLRTSGKLVHCPRNADAE
jgi:hypothetical protein